MILPRCDNKLHSHTSHLRCCSCLSSVISYRDALPLAAYFTYFVDWCCHGCRHKPMTRSVAHKSNTSNTDSVETHYRRRTLVIYSVRPHMPLIYLCMLMFLSPVTSYSPFLSRRSAKCCRIVNTVAY